MSKLLDITEDAVLLLRAVQDTGGRFGLNLPIEVLRGCRNARIGKSGFERLPIHGAGSSQSEEYWKAVGRSLVQELLLDARGTGKGFGKGAAKVYAVSVLGKALLEGRGGRIRADLAADAAVAQHERAVRQAKRRPKEMATAAQPPHGAEAPAASAVAASATPQAKRRKGRPGGKQGSGEQGPTPPGKSAVPPRAGCKQDVAEPDVDDEMGTAVEADFDGLRPPPNEGPIATPAPLPAALDAALLPFQRAGVAFAVRRSGRLLFGDDMGLGKTIQAIATCCAFRQDWPVLVVAPNSMRLVWADELERWIPDIGPSGVNVVRSSQDLLGFSQPSTCFHIVTYGILSRPSPVRDFLREQAAFRVLVVDESHMIKTRTALRTREVLQLVKRASRVVLLSGTPALARPVELYPQIEAIAPGTFGSYSSFASRYCAPKWTPFGMDYSGASHLDELHAKLRSLMVRRLKKDVLDELPAKRRQRVQLELTGSASEACRKAREDLRIFDEEQVAERRRRMMELYSLSAQAKAEAASEYVEDLIHGGCKFLVFGHHRVMLDALEAAAVRAKVGSIRIDGGVNSAERLRLVASFQSDPRIRVAVLGLLAAGVGLTLTAASTVVFAELHWTPGVLVQAEDRAHRIGQHSSVNVHYLIAGGTIDDIIWPSVSRKVEVISTLCDGRRDKLVASMSRGRTFAAGSSAETLETEQGEADEADLMDVDGLIEVVDAAEVRKSGKKTPAEAAAAGDPATKSSRYSVLTLLRGKPAKEARWACGSCGASNTGEDTACSGCGGVRTAAPSAPLPHRSPPAPEPDRAAAAAASGTRTRSFTEEPIESDSPPGAASPDKKEVEADAKHSFWVTRLTGRVHVLRPDGSPLGVNFKLADWEIAQELPENLPLSPEAAEEAEAFLRAWASLKTTEQRQLSDKPLKPPLHRLLLELVSSTARSTRRLGAKPRGRPRAAAAAAAGRAEAPEGEAPASQACAWCGAALPSTDAGSAYCSGSCEEKGRVRYQVQVARRQLFDLERGVCRVCGLDAHALFKRVMAQDPPERHQELMRAGFSINQSLLERPNEGMFWQADHILPVAEGGGEADLTNYRTLCTICHLKETRRLQGRLRRADWGRGSCDIRASVARGAADAIDITCLDDDEDEEGEEGGGGDLGEEVVVL